MTHTLDTFGPHAVFDFNLKQFSENYCVYTHSLLQQQTDGQMRWQVMYVGVCKLNNVLSPMDCRRNSMWIQHVSKQTFRVEVLVTGPEIACHMHASKIRTEQKPYCNLYGFTIKRSTVVRCIDTGELFASQNAAAERFGIHPTTMSNHLNGRKEYETVHGMKFERVL